MCVCVCVCVLGLSVAGSSPGKPSSLSHTCTQFKAFPCQNKALITASPLRPLVPELGYHGNTAQTTTTTADTAAVSAIKRLVSIPSSLVSGGGGGTRQLSQDGVMTFIKWLVEMH